MRSGTATVGIGKCPQVDRSGFGSPVRVRGRRCGYHFNGKSFIVLKCRRSIWGIQWNRFDNVGYISETSVYPAKGRPGSRTTKLDSGAQKRLILLPSRATGHAPGQRAIGPCRSRTLGQRAGVCANSDRGPLRRPARVTRGDFLEICHFAPFSQFLHIKGRNFPDVFSHSRLPMTSINHEKLHGNRSARFWEIRKTDRQTDTATLYNNKMLKSLDGTCHVSKSKFWSQRQSHRVASLNISKIIITVKQLLASW